MNIRGTVLLLPLLLGIALSDIYLHNPRGSNNRLAEKTANRANGNRLFDSQNNNKGGYNTGDRLDKGAGNEPRLQYSMQFYSSGGQDNEGSELVLEWTDQHGCGTSPVNRCNLVIQYMCMSNGTDTSYPRGTKANVAAGARAYYMRDGVSTTTQGYDAPAKGETPSEFAKRMKTNMETNVADDRGLHETVWWYDQCRYREANGGLFRADRKLKKDTLGYISASRTRQNENGNRNGFECPEERDYYPYWAPTLQADDPSKDKRTPWIDLAWLGDSSKCDYIKQSSFNQQSRFKCVFKGSRTYGKSINKDDCTKEGGEWVEFHSFIDILTDITNEGDCNKNAKKDKRNSIKWLKLRNDTDEYSCVVQAPLPICQEAPATRINHLGNSLEGDAASQVKVNMPYFPSMEAKRCVMRIRYNITTKDYNPHITDYKFNNDLEVIENDPEVNVFKGNKTVAFELALNTAQTGRTFQDRSHVFVVLPRLASMEEKKLLNVNVRGKRGNIVQVYPAVEYDFAPSNLTVGRDDLLHIQWTGSNTHNNGGENDGEGTQGTDRSNLLLMSDPGLNYPQSIEKSMDFWEGVKSLNHPEATSKDIAIGLATAGYYCGDTEYATCPKEFTVNGRKVNIDNKMNNAPASYFGHVLKMGQKGTVHYVCTRNNNFSNRGQKGTLKSTGFATSLTNTLILIPAVLLCFS